LDNGGHLGASGDGGSLCVKWSDTEGCTSQLEYSGVDMTNFFDFTGKVVLVTGASSGIGRATAELFGRCGASVAITYLNNKTGADEAVASISSSGGKAPVAIKSDVTHTSEVERMIREVEEALGPV